MVICKRLSTREPAGTLRRSNDGHGDGTDPRAFAAEFYGEPSEGDLAVFAKELNKDDRPIPPHLHQVGKECWIKYQLIVSEESKKPMFTPTEICTKRLVPQNPYFMFYTDSIEKSWGSGLALQHSYFCLSIRLRARLTVA